MSLFNLPLEDRVSELEHRVRRLEAPYLLFHQELSQLRAENQRLRDELARALERGNGGQP
jgi:uncharacterized protein YdcH (DUF465 family)